MNPYTVAAIVIAVVLFVLVLVFRHVRRRRKHDRLIALIAKLDGVSKSLYGWARRKTLAPGPLKAEFDEEARELLRQIAELSTQIELLSDELDGYDWCPEFRVWSFTVNPLCPLLPPARPQYDPEVMERRREMGVLIFKAIELIFAPPRRVRVVA